MGYNASKKILLIEVEFMSTILTEVTSMSSRGQVVLPKNIRESLALIPGARLMVLSDGDNILLKPIKQPDISEFSKLMDEAENWANNVGMTEDDITEAIESIRARKRG